MTPRRRTGEQDYIMNTVDIWKGIAKYGLPTALLIPLLYFQIVVVRADQRADQKALFNTQTEIVTEQRLLGNAILKLADRIGEQNMLSEKILLVQRVYCVNAARNQNDRLQCLREQ